MLSLEKTIAGIVSAKFGIPVQDVDCGTVFWRDLSADGVDMAELGFAIEDEFGFEIFDDEMDRLRTVADLRSLVEMRLADSECDAECMAMAA
jgi:acyl carrier protein